MSSFEAVVDAVREEGTSLREQLARQHAGEESPAAKDAKENAAVKREEKTNDTLEEILKALGFGKKIEKAPDEKGGLLSAIFGTLIGGSTMSALIAGLATLTDTDAALRAFGLPKTFENVVGALKLFKKITLLPFTLTTKLIDSIGTGVNSIVTFFKGIPDLKPEIKLPEFKFPEFKFSKFTLPEFKLPVSGISARLTEAFEVAEIKFPKFTLPDLPTIPDDVIDIERIKSIIGSAGTPDAPGKGLLGFLNGLKNLIPTETIKKIGSFGFETIKSIIGSAGTPDAPGKGLLGFLNGVKGLIPEKAIKALTGAGKFSLAALKVLVRPFVQFFLSLFDFVGGVFKGAEEGQKEQVGIQERIRLMFVRGIEGIATGLGEALELVFVDLTGWIAGKLGFDEFKKFLATIDFTTNIRKSFDYLFGIGEYREKGGLPSDIGTLFAEAIPKALEKGKAKILAIGDTIANFVTSISDWFKESFKLENIIKILPESVVNLLKFAGKIPKTADDLRKELEELEKGIAEGTGYGGIGASGLDLFTSEEELEAAKKQAEMLKNQLASMRTGGITTQSGLVNIHPQEAVIPLEKMDEVVNRINQAAINKSGTSGTPIVVNNVSPTTVNAPTSNTTNSAASIPIGAPVNYAAIL